MPRYNRCMYMTHVCFYVCCSDCVGVCWNVFCVAAVVKNSGFLSLGVLKYVVCLCRGCDGCCVFCLYCEAWSCRRPYGRGIHLSRSHDCLIDIHECHLLFTPSCCSECFYDLQRFVCLY